MTRLEYIKTMMEFTKNFYTKYHKEVTTTYKYRGEIKTRTSLELTEEGKKLLDLKYNNSEYKFICPCCHKQVSFGKLETWLGETPNAFMNNKVICSNCYENEMGDDL